MQRIVTLLLVLCILSPIIYSQETKKVDSPQAAGDKVIIKDGLTSLIEVENEGSAGSIILPDVGNVLSGTKLYNNGANLYWGGSQLNLSSGANSINDLSDAQNDESSLYLGSGAGGTNDDGSNSNTGIGNSALFRNTSGSSNTASGSGALSFNTTGSFNTAIGNAVLLLSNGSENTAIGSGALFFNTSGSQNTAIGTSALKNNATGSGNTAIGHLAGTSLNNLLNTTALGNQATVTADNSIAIGNTSVGSIKGQVVFSTFSDGRYKENIQEDIAGIEFINGLRPVSYNIDINSLADKLGEDMQIDENGQKTMRQPNAEIVKARNDKSNKRQIGFIAQEVESLVNDLDIEFSGVEIPQNEESMYSLRYAEFVVPLVKAVQEQQEMIEKLRDEIEELKKTK